MKIVLKVETVHSEIESSNWCSIVYRKFPQRSRGKIFRQTDQKLNIPISCFEAISWAVKWSFKLMYHRLTIEKMKLNKCEQNVNSAKVIFCRFLGGKLSALRLWRLVPLPLFQMKFLKKQITELRWIRLVTLNFSFFSSFFEIQCQN